MLFTITSLARTTGTPLTTKTRWNAQKGGFSAPKTSCFHVAGLLPKSRGWFHPIKPAKGLFFPELP